MVTITPFFDAFSSTFTYAVFDPQSRDTVIIDPVLDYDPLTATVSCASINRVEEYLERNELKVGLILDTHVHADHMTGAFFLKNRLGVQSAIGQDFLKCQQYFATIFGLESALMDLPPAYDLLLKHGQVIQVGSLQIKTLLVPGHTPSCASYLIGDALFTGDALFQPELGCGRADFPGGSAQALYHSIKEHIYTLPDTTKLMVGHDYPGSQEQPRHQCFVGESKRHNIMLNEHMSETEFMNKRKAKDQSLQPPRLLLPAMQVNITGGQLPKPDQQGRMFLRLPLRVK